MPTLAHCDPARPLHVSAFVDEYSDEPAFVELAQLHGDDAFRRIATPRGEPLEITPPGVAALLRAITETPWREAFEHSLQALVETDAGEPLLTALIPHEDASDMLRHIVSHGGDAGDQATAVLDAMHLWAQQVNGPFTLVIDAYQRA